MPKKPKPFVDWVCNIKKCADCIRAGGTVRSAMKIHYGIMRHAKDVVYSVVKDPNYVITTEMHKSYLNQQAKKRYKPHERVLNNIRIMSNEELRKYKKKPPFVSDQRWRIHLDWRKRMQYYNSIPPGCFL